MTAAATKPLLLVIEDHPDILEIVKYNLEREGYRVESAMDGTEGLKKALSLSPALILLDLMLPKLGGLDVCREIRRSTENSKIPIIMLTAKGGEADIVRGLEAGADDYVTKPFSPKELVARVRSVLRRALSEEGGKNQVRVRDIVVDISRHEVTVGNLAITLTLAEFKLLRYLGSHPGRVFTRDQLITQMTDGEAVIIDRNVDVHISALRRKLGDHGKLIETVRGVGYRLAE